MQSKQSKLHAALNRARAAIIGQPTMPSGAEEALRAPSAPLRAPEATMRPVEPSAPRVVPTMPSAAQVRQRVQLSRGAALLFDELHALAVHVAQERAYATTPSSVVFHLPAVIVAALVGYSERHLYRLADELRGAGLLDERGHVGQVGNLRRYDGTLWAVPLVPGHRPRLRFDELRHDWRPDFAEDALSEKGAWHDVQSVLAEPCTFKERSAKLRDLAKSWAVGSRTAKTPTECGSDIRPGRVLAAIADDLPVLLGLHPRQRHREVSRMAADLAHVLGEAGRMKQWCGAIYRALEEENQLRPGLAYLAAQLQRLAADLREGAPWRSPGAVLAARLS